jgi:hypothetical protein
MVQVVEQPVVQQVVTQPVVQQQAVRTVVQAAPQIVQVHSSVRSLVTSDDMLHALMLTCFMLSC